MLLNFILSDDGLPVPDGETDLSHNRSFLFGDGFFETIRLGKNGFCPLATLHASRIARSAAFLKFTEWESFDENKFHHLMASLKLPTLDYDWKVKVIFFRTGPGSFTLPEHSGSRIFITCEKLTQPFFQKLEVIRESSSIQIFPSSWGWLKSTSALPYVLAGMERKEKQADELVLCSADGTVVEGSYTSICWKDAEGIHFSPRRLGGVDSCQRRFTEHFFRQNGTHFSEKETSFSQLLKESEWIAFLSALGIRFFFPAPGRTLPPPEFEAFPHSR